MSDVYLLGTDMIKFGRFPDRSVPQIGAQAALMALDDSANKSASGKTRDVYGIRWPILVQFTAGIPALWILGLPPTVMLVSALNVVASSMGKTI